MGVDFSDKATGCVFGGIAVVILLSAIYEFIEGNWIVGLACIASPLFLLGPIWLTVKLLADGYDSSGKSSVEKDKRQKEGERRD